VEFGSRGIPRTVAGADDQVDGRQLVLMQTERLADDPANTVALDATAGDTNRDGEPETRPTLFVPKRSHAKESIAKPLSARVDRFEVRFATQASLRGESQPCWGRANAGQVGATE
jgi:hypothetical protein